MSKKMMNKKLLTVFFILFASCTFFKASPAMITNFLPFPEVMTKKLPRTPFHTAWVFDEMKYAEIKNRYKKILISPVSTEFINKAINASDWSDSSKRDRIEELQEVARYMREKFRLEIEKRKGHPVKVVESEGSDTFVLKLALTELVPTNPLVNTVGTAAGFFVPGGGLIKIAGKGSVAMEGFERDALPPQTVFFQFADRESDKAAPFTVKDFQRYAHVRGAVDEWAGQYAELVTTKLDHKVDDSLPFTLSPF